MTAPDFRPGQRAYLRVKRVIDALLAGTALVLLAPLLLLVCALVLLMLGRPALFVQERVTLDGKRFRLRKFRTMRPEDPARGWVGEGERLTAFGRALRASSLDELPSLWNILVGDMSLIGPRPLPSRYLSLYSPEQSGRHRVRAGLTGLAQVSGRNGVPWDERLELDQRYVMLCSPLLDLQIFLRTFVTVLSREGVTEGDHATSTDFPGPMHTPRLRFVSCKEAGVPCGEAGSDAATQWIALTPQNEPIARCGLAVADGGRARLTLAPREGEPDDLLAEALVLLLSRARAHDCESAELRLRLARPVPAPLLARAGFRRQADVPADDSAGAPAEVLFSTTIGCHDALSNQKETAHEYADS